MNFMLSIRNKLLPPHFSILHRFVRNTLLPIKELQNHIQKTMHENSISKILDFGSGMLYWSHYFANQYNCTVYAVDTYYEIVPPPNVEKIIFYSDFNVCFKDISTFDLVWICDVLHHIPPSIYEEFMRKIVRMADIIIIKDIDARHTVGNFMNRMQDKLVNGETVYNIDPRQIGSFLETNGYMVSEYYIPKFWYPHFLLIAKRVKL